ncbi:MAG: TIGR03663 family protein [Bdellovibrio sp.]|nr:TIGR03663 family protein [Bdellovibrio sp.]
MKSVKGTHYSLAVAWMVLLCGAIFTRFYDLTNKPLHFDESINGWFVLQMQTVGFYKYDPNNYHGPLYFYMLQFFELLWGQSIETLRALPAVFSVLSVMIFSFGFLSSKSVQRWMMLLLLLSPAFLFFGRSGIHEMPFVFFQIVFALGVLRWLEKSDAKAWALGLVGLWGMVTLKETFTITLFCWALALSTLGLSEVRRLFSWKNLKEAWNPRLTVLLSLLGLFFVQLFTGFFKNGSGLLDFIKAFLPWLKTGVEGKGHEKPFGYWLQVLGEAEPLVLLGVGIAFIGVFSRHKSLRVMSVFSLSQLLIYSLIPYKTVWCILSLIWGFYFVLAIFFAEVLAEKGRWKYLFGGVAMVLMGFGVRSAYNSVYRHPLQMEHPYIYVNSTYEMKSLYDFLRVETRLHPELLGQTVQIGMKEQWPWPWVLRTFKDLRYDLCGKRVIENALIYLCDFSGTSEVELSLVEPYWKIPLSFRQSREMSYVYLKKAAFPQIPFTKQVEIVGSKEE